MSARPPTRASDVAARQVEQIVSAAMEAAEQIREDAQRDLIAIRERGEREVDQALNGARKEAILLTQEARRDAEDIVKDANAEATRLRDSTERAVQGRVAAAEKAAAEVLAEARALSGGLNQLGRSLEEQANRILRDVSAAHKRMQADLRIAAPAKRPAPSASSDGPAPETPALGRSEPSRRVRANPFEDLEVPSWE